MPNPLSGKQIVVTRAESQAGDFTSILTAMGAEVIACPTIQTVPPVSWESLDRAIFSLGDYDWIFFTSANAVSFFFQRWGDIAGAGQPFPRLKICAIGKATATALEKRKCPADLISKESKAEGVIESFCAFYGGADRVAGLRVLLPRAETAREVLAVELPKIGVSIEVAVAYRTIRPDGDPALLASRFQAAEIDVITFTSPSTVNHFVAMFADYPVSELLKHASIASIGPVTTEAVRAHGLEVHIQPAEYTTPALAAAIGEFFRNQ